jgi:hypothetical protein
MSFLDNLENNLKALERVEERDPEKVKRDHERRDQERSEAMRRAPFVDALKKSAFTQSLLGECRVLGRTERVLVQFVWLGETLRLTAQSKRMDLIPSADGIAAVFSVDGAETGRAMVNPDSDDPAALAHQWLTA